MLTIMVLTRPSLVQPRCNVSAFHAINELATAGFKLEIIAEELLPLVIKAVHIYAPSAPDCSWLRMFGP